jgi:cholesterol transport system auxiliary component
LGLNVHYLSQFASRRLTAVAIAALLLGGCTGMLKEAPVATYDLTAPQAFSGRATSGRGVLVVDEPTAIQTVDSNRMVARQGGAVSYVPAAQWTDRLPILVQTRIVQAFENSGRIGSVGRAQDRLAGDYQLITDIRSFEIDVAGRQAKVSIAAKIVDRGGRVRSGRVFEATAPAGPVNGPAASQALDKALGQVLVDMVGWAAGHV